MSGKLFLVPTPLDFGVDTGAAPANLQQVLPLQVIQVAARLEHWVAENAKTTRAFLKRVNMVVPLAQPLQNLQIAELPRPQKGAKTAERSGLEALLAPATQGHDMGLVSEAGLPAVADPGAALVQGAHTLGIEVVPLSAASGREDRCAVTSAEVRSPRRIRRSRVRTSQKRGSSRLISMRSDLTRAGRHVNGRHEFQRIWQRSIV